MVERQVRIESRVGLHARPAALFVQAATKAPMEVTVAKPGGVPVNAKSILAVLELDLRHGEEIVIRVAADNDDSAGAIAVVDELAGLIGSPESEDA